jgi:predicted dehydrogenase
MSALRVGIIGTGAIAPAYMEGTSHFTEDIQIVACADIAVERAQAFAERYYLQAMSIDDLLTAPDIDIILNLTIPAVHAEVSLQILNAGKHVYLEKPLAVELPDAQKVMDVAAEKGLRVGCAPDTFLGGGGQTARRAIDEGLIGHPIAATAFFMSHGPESWHPNPFFYYSAGGGPMLDMGPYYLTTLVNLMGPMTQVMGMTGRAFDQRVAGHESISGQTIDVSVATHTAGTIRFASGAIATVITSFDVWQDHVPRIEIHGTEGSLSVPDPNIFGGKVQVWRPDKDAWQTVESQHRDDIQRGIGLADMARSIQADEPHRASGEMALHVLEAMLSFDRSSDSNSAVTLGTTVDQPMALPPNR